MSVDLIFVGFAKDFVALVVVPVVSIERSTNIHSVRAEQYLYIFICEENEKD